MKKAIIYYFSGSGNSYWITEKITTELKRLNYDVNIINIEKKSIDENHSNADLLAFVLPVYGFGLPQLAAKFLAKLPKSNKQKTFVILSPAIHEGIGMLQCLFYLSAKKYNVLKAETVKMPDTWIAVMNAPSETKIEKVCKDKEDLISKTINEIENNEKSLSIANPFAIFGLGLIYSLFTTIGRQLAGKTFTSTTKCNKCKICYNNCPSKTIKWKENGPYWSWNCQQCFRCINLCPQNAVEISNTSLILTLISGFSGYTLYKHIPVKALAKLNIIHPIPEIITALICIIITAWLCQSFMYHNVFPKWYLTKTRKRYDYFKNKLLK